MTDTPETPVLKALEILTPNIQCEIRGAEGSEAAEMKRLWEVIRTALQRSEKVDGLLVAVQKSHDVFHTLAVTHTSDWELNRIQQGAFRDMASYLCEALKQFSGEEK